MCSGAASVVSLTQYGKPLTASYLSDQVSRYIKQAKINKEGPSHLFRHSMATHMLETALISGTFKRCWDMRILALTTQIDTQVSVGQLKKMCRETHLAQQKKGVEVA